MLLVPTKQSAATAAVVAVAAAGREVVATSGAFFSTKFRGRGVSYHPAQGGKGKGKGGGGVRKCEGCEGVY